MEPNPNKKTVKTPDSDETARKDGADVDTADREDLATANGQTSNNSGKHSSVEKLTASRPESGVSRGAKPVPGAFGNPENDDQERTGRSEAHRDRALQQD